MMGREAHHHDEECREQFRRDHGQEVPRAYWLCTCDPDKLNAEIERLRAENERLRKAATVICEYPPADVLAARLRLSRWREGGGWDGSIYPGNRNIVDAVAADDRLVGEWNLRQADALAVLTHRLA